MTVIVKCAALLFATFLAVVSVWYMHCICNNNG